MNILFRLNILFRKILNFEFNDLVMNIFFVPDENSPIGDDDYSENAIDRILQTAQKLVLSLLRCITEATTLRSNFYFYYNYVMTTTLGLT